MVTIKDGCGCGTASCCSWKDKLEEAYKRATASVNKIGDDSGNVYFPDGTGYVKVPLPTRAQVAQIQTNADDIATLKQRATASEGNIDTLKQDIVRIDAKDTTQDQSIKDNSDRITSTNNDLVATEATVATHDSDIITLKANNQALAKSLVSDVIMTDGTTAGSVQVSIEREDGALITSANYKWGRDIGVRLEAGTQAGYMKTVIDLSDGTTLTSNEYKIVEVLESDVYVTAITLVPDMTAGTIGGNISYSNGTTQTINAVNVPTAPGVTSAIETLQSRMTAVENTNNTQASEITALTNRVQAIEDTPGVGQFGAGKLGTIAGSATDGKVKAEDDGTGSVNGWSALKQRVTAAEGQIVNAQNDISALDGTVSQQTTDISGLMTDITNLEKKNTEQDQSIAANTSALAGKVDIAQGAENAGKALVVGNDGNISFGTIPKKLDPYLGEIPAKAQESFPSTAYRSNSIVTYFIPIIETSNGNQRGITNTIVTTLNNTDSEESVSQGFFLYDSDPGGAEIKQALTDFLSNLNLSDGTYHVYYANYSNAYSYFLSPTSGRQVAANTGSFITINVNNGSVSYPSTFMMNITYSSKVDTSIKIYVTTIKKYV